MITQRSEDALFSLMASLMPPELYDVLDACPTVKTGRTPGAPAEVDLSGVRDRALLLVGFVAALRRSGWRR